MIFIGDIAAGTAAAASQLNQVFSENSFVFQGKSLIGNLEGLVTDNDSYSKASTPLLFNHPDTISVLKRHGARVLTLANNHTLDIPHHFTNTVDSLNSHDILYLGASMQREALHEPVVFEENGQTVVLFNACWDFLLYHQDNPSENVFVATINELELLHSVKKHRALLPKAKLMVYLHWSFDLEILPFPMYREWARALIDAGCTCVIGCHSHCVQGGEKYQDGYIVYGLGNFFMPWGYFANGTLSFPEFSRIQMTFEYDIVTDTAYCHWFEYMNKGDKHALQHISSEPFESSPLLEKYSSYAGLDRKEYVDFYKKNRRKKRGIPVFTAYTNTIKNKIYTVYLKNRARFARALARRGWLKWQH